MGFLSSISIAFQEGGIWMWAILATQIAATAIIIERAIFLYKKIKPEAKNAIALFETDIKKGDVQAACDKAKAAGTAGAGNIQPIYSVIEAGTKAAANYAGQNEIQAKMDEVLLETNSKFDERIGYLAMLGNVATLLGLLGTITGMIKSFAAVAFVNPMEKATLLAQGISEAMHATAYGLIVAIPALAFYAIFQSRATKLSEDLNQSSLKVFNWLSYSFENITQKPARPMHSASKSNRDANSQPEANI